MLCKSGNGTHVYRVGEEEEEAELWREMAFALESSKVKVTFLYISPTYKFQLPMHNVHLSLADPLAYVLGLGNGGV